MPAQPRTRVVAPVPLPAPEEARDAVPEAFAAKTVRKRQVRRAQMATADQKVALPPQERAAEDPGTGDLKATIAGRTFRLSDRIGFMTVMEFAAIQADGELTDSVFALLMFRMMKDLVHPQEWDAFRAHTRDAKCSAADFTQFQNAALEAITARPTGAPAAS
jgi:hypothetical protein